MSHRRSGFTLIELMLAICIAVLLLALAVPSMRGMSKEQKLLETFRRFDDMARKAQSNAVSQQRAWTVFWDAGAIYIRPEEPTPQERIDADPENGGSFESMAVGENENYSLERPVALLPLADLRPEWTFWRSGTCEPVIIRYQGPAGSWVAQYHPLTGHGEITEQYLP